MSELFGGQTTLRLFMEHRSTLLKLKVNRIADDLESQNESNHKSDDNMDDS